jgi:hypothetical protein
MSGHTLRPRGGQRWENRYAYDKISENADQTEWDAFLHGQAHISSGVIDDTIAETGDDMVEPGARDDRLQGGEVIQEALQGSVAELILERKELLGAAYPFEIDGNSIIYQPATPPVYECLLGICLADSLSAAPYDQLPQLFEELSILAGRSFLGSNTNGYRSGWPRPQGEALRLRAIIAHIKEITGNHCGEWYWRPGEELPDDPTSRNVKDGGLDVVIWRSWQDGRTGQLYLLGQCACGKDWIDKFKDLDIGALKRWADLTHVEPIRGFFTPRYAVKSLLSEASKEAGLVFDRVRMVQSLVASHISAELNEISEKIHSGLEVAKFPM